MNFLPKRPPTLIQFSGATSRKSTCSGRRSANGPFLRNSVYANDALGIDLNDDGVTANDVGDVDSGDNNRQNFPVLSGAFTDGTGTVAVTGSINTTAYTSLRIEFFANTGAGNEGETYLGYRNVITDSNDVAVINFTFSMSSF